MLATGCDSYRVKRLGATLALICVLVWVAATNAPRFTVFGIGGYAAPSSRIFTESGCEN